MPTKANSLVSPPSRTAMRGPGSMRQANEWVVLRHLRGQAPLSTSQLSSGTGLSRPTVNLAVARLEAAGLVRQTGLRTGRAGRAPRLWEPDVDAGRVVSVHVSSHRIRLALADLGETVVERRQEPAQTRDATQLVQQIARLVTDLLEGNGVARSDVHSIVIASPGIYDPASRRVRQAVNIPGWDRPAVVALLAEELGDRVSFENDVDLAALGEQAAGVGRGIDDFVFLSVGTGIGIGTITGGRLHRGARGAAGEASFLLVGDPTGLPAGELRERGMFESSAGAEAIVAAAREAGLGADCTPDQVFTAARQGDPAAAAVIARETDLLARALVPVIALLDPQLIVLGGSALGRHAPHLVKPLVQRLTELIPLPLPDLAASTVGEDATVTGGIAQATAIAWRHAYLLSQG
ncbi:ROK family transcriptional regulator [Streptomyces sp. NPDC059740]|uniref:ROK family transcriptional regulator n=1 Tax=Streptomyces sp. NPDC059740 TaxID=3346926 RepID=UPI003648FF5B